MKLLQFISITFFMTTGCGMPMTDEIDESAKKGSETQSELGALKSLVSLPRKPEAIRWENDESKTGDNSSLIVLMRFSEEDYKFIIENSRKFEVQNDELVDKAFYERWLKEHLPSIVQVTSQGEFVILQDIYGRSPGVKAIAARDPFFWAFNFYFQLSARFLSMVAVTLTYIRRLIKALLSCFGALTRYVRATLALAALKHPLSLSDFVSTRLLPVRINPLIHHLVRYPENEVFLFKTDVLASSFVSFFEPYLTASLCRVRYDLIKSKPVEPSSLPWRHRLFARLAERLKPYPND